MRLLKAGSFPGFSPKTKIVGEMETFIKRQLHTQHRCVGRRADREFNSSSERFCLGCFCRITQSTREKRKRLEGHWGKIPGVILIWGDGK